MKTNVALKYQPFKEALAHPATVTSLYEHKEKQIEKILNSNVRIAGCGNVKLKQLFSSSNRGAVVVIRRRNGSYAVNPGLYRC
ncbi:MAG: hypothetical protein U9R02_10570 [Thermodesulfobacteriota bacterium]|nr:hypothetical protein [Thermodesulfobacteriota bacterium]